MCQRITVNTDIVYYKSESLAPMFDLLLGTETMKRLGIILDFKNTMITIDQMRFLMRDIKNLQSSDYRKGIISYTYFQEPHSTDQAMKPAVKIMDAKYEKSDIPSVIEANCAHLVSIYK